MTTTPEQEDWEINIRTDMWHNMSVHQLNVQRELIITKISTLMDFGTSHETARNILIALQRAHDHLNNLIDNNFDEKKRNIT